MKYFDKDILNDELKSWLAELDDNELSKNTLKRYKINITSFINFADKKPIEKNTIKEYKAKLENVDRYLTNTSNNYLVVLNHFLKYIDLSDLTVKLFRLQRKDSAEESISYTDYHRLLRCTKAKNDISTYTILRILAETGIRVSELKFFTVEKLDDILTIKNKNKVRNIVIKNDLLKFLKKYCRENKIESGYIFPGLNGERPLHDSSIRKKLKKAAGYSKIRLSKVHPHSFRHYFAKRFLEMYPDDVLTLADLLGHSSLETTRIYVKLSNKEKEKRLRNVKF